MDPILTLILISVSISSCLTTHAAGGGGGRFQSQVLAVHRRFSGASVHHDRSRHLAAAVDLPLGHNEKAIGLYYTQVKIGSPAQNYYPVVDTGSDIFWLICNQENLYYPGKSRSARVIHCDNDLCIFGCKRSLNCNYHLSYADGTSSRGFMVTDQLQLDFVSHNLTTSTLNTSIVLGPHYIVNMLAIEVGKHTLRLGTINGVEIAIDCGSTLSFLPGEIYEVIVTQILSKHNDSTLFFVDDLHCFDYNESVDVGFPTITLHFEGFLELVVYPREYLFYNHVNQYCLGLRKSGSLTNGLKNMAFLGDNLLSHKFVLYDIENEAVGWTPYDCFSSVGVQDGNSTTVYDVRPHHVYAPLRETSASRSRDRSVMIYLAILLSLLLILKFR